MKHPGLVQSSAAPALVAGATATSAAEQDEAAAGAVWRVHVLGRFEIDDGRQRLTRLRSRAAMALLARLALAPQRAHGREELAALLWPEASAQACRSRLRQTLSLLRAVLEPPGAPGVLLVDRRVLRVAPGALWCDAVAFEAALRGPQPDTAHRLWRGDLLPGFYDEWIGEERLRLAALHDRLPVPQAAPTNHAAPTVQAAQPLQAAQVPAGPWPPAARPTPPAPAPAPAPSALRLPSYLTRLVGADQAGARLLALVGAQRLVTVLGPGGCGKTRLAVEVAALAGTAAGDAPARFDSVVFVSLVDAVDSTALLDRLLQALRLGGAGAAQAQLAQALTGRRALLLLDNAEQLDEGAVAALDALVAALPQVHWLVTSRRPLELDGEHSHVLEALPLPEAGASLAELALNPAMALLVDRVRAHRPDFHLTPARQPALVALVCWLEGLPLALELAAATLRSQGPAELLALLRQGREQGGGAALDYLARRGPRAGGDPRHASMRAVVDGSWRLLDEPQRDMLRALCLLPAGAPPWLAAALGAAEGLAPLQAQAVLDALVACSVLRAQPSAADRARYQPFEPVREYALASLAAAQRAALLRRVLAALLAWARSLPETPPLQAVREELPTLTFALAQADAVDDAARLVLHLQSSWGEMALPGGVLLALDTLLGSARLDPGLAAGCHALAATFHCDAGRPEDARRHRECALHRLQACAQPDPAVQVMVLGRVARMHWRLDRNHQRARELIAQALPLARAAQRPNSEASLLSLQAHLTSQVDRQPQRAAALSAQALALWTRSGNRHLINAGRYNLATHRMRSGAQAEVLDEFAALAQEGRELQDWDLAAGALEARGTALLGLRRWQASADDLRESVRLAWDGMETLALVHALWNLPPALVRLRQAELAAQTMGAAEALWRLRFGAFDDHDQRDLKRVRRGTRALLGAAGAQAAWHRGAQLPLAEAVSAALARPRS